jgi:hypothetical protein
MRFALWLGRVILLLASAQGVLADAEEHCPSGNLLQGLAPVSVGGVEAPERLTDGVAVIEGDPWDSVWATRFRDRYSAVNFDLQRPTTLRLLLLQADGNDRYQVDVSLDGKTWRSLDPIQRTQEPGLRARESAFDAVFRYLRIRPLDGDGSFSISEVRAFCRVPATTPKIIIRETPVPGPPKFNASQRQAAWGKVALSVLAFVVLALTSKGLGPGDPLTRSRLAAGIAFSAASGALLWTLGLALGVVTSLVGLSVCAVWIQRTGAVQRLRTVAYLGLVVASGCAWTNFGYFSGHFVHHHDVFHYYLGSKYAKEIGYSNLYRCAALAEAEDNGPASVAQRLIRDLAIKGRQPGHELLTRPELCKDAFREDRWQNFKRDVAFFRSLMPDYVWEAVFVDHGYNPPPLWTAIGRPLTVGGALTHRRLLLLTLIDPLLYAAALAALAWAFGLATCALAAVVWATGMPWDVTWVGGGFARTPWFLGLVASIALAKKHKYAASGAALAFSSLLRIFPILLATGPLFAMLGRWGRPAVVHWRFVLGGVLAGVLLLVGSAVVVGPASYRDFVSHIHRHDQKVGTNEMGLATLLAWHPDRTAIKTHDFALAEPADPWAAAKEETLRERAPIRLAVVLIVVAGLWIAARRLETWKLLCLGIVLTGVAIELSGYYFVMLAAVAPLAVDRLTRYGSLLLAVLLTLLVPLLGRLNYEEPFVVYSAIILAALLWIGVDVVWETHRARGQASAVESP